MRTAGAVLFRIFFASSPDASSREWPVGYCYYHSCFTSVGGGLRYVQCAIGGRHRSRCYASPIAIFQWEEMGGITVWCEGSVRCRQFARSRCSWVRDEHWRAEPYGRGLRSASWHRAQYQTPDKKPEKVSVCVWQECRAYRVALDSAVLARRSALHCMTVCI